MSSNPYHHNPHRLTDPVQGRKEHEGANTTSSNHLHDGAHSNSTSYHLHPDFDPTAHPSCSPTRNPSVNRTTSESTTQLLLPHENRVHEFQLTSCSTLIDSTEQNLLPDSTPQSPFPSNHPSASKMASQHQVYFPPVTQSSLTNQSNYHYSSNESYLEDRLSSPNSPHQFHRPSPKPVLPLNGDVSFAKELVPSPVLPPSRRKRLSHPRFALLALLGCALIGVAVGVICFAHQRRIKNTSGVTGGDGDVIAKSGLGSARNGTGTDDPDQFGGVPSSEPTGSNNGTHYDSLVVFGASYCDNAHARPSLFQSTLKPPPYFKGRWTDGYVWNEYLAQMIGPGGGRTTLVNYAYGSATVDNTISSASVPDFEEQVQAFTSDLHAHSPGAGPYNGKTLLAAWVGINSVTKIWNQVLHGEMKAQTQSQAHSSVVEARININASVDEIFTVMGNLSRSTSFNGPPPDLLLLPIPPGPLLPANIRAAKGNTRSLQTLGELTDMFNDRFLSQYAEFQTQLLPGQRVFTYDIPRLWQDFIINPASYGLSVVDQPCFSHNVVCPHPNEYLFWDSLHPTTYIHHKLATLLRDAIRS